ncbi:hypothetical protein GCM10009431_13690 [Gaetbulibacter jejuensis]|uniref:Uncharacterized protein n=1 Tax=Gaetbulibacter jejuensis TaxID=584607 RepID=A0ABN1JKZ2_9FLAO
MAIFEPITFPKEISEEPSKAACKLTNNSGAEVAKDTTVIPITSLDNFNLNESATDERTKNSPPTTKSNNPKITQITLIKTIFWRRYYLVSICAKN